MRRIDLSEIFRSLPEAFPGIRKVSREIVYLMGCRNFDQFCCTSRALVHPEQYCPFCTAELSRRGRASLAETTGWLLLENEFPHKNTDKMLLIVPKRHIFALSELNTLDWSNIGELIVQCQTQHGIPDGGIMWRFGEPAYNVGTVEHAHLNMIRPIPGKEYRAPFAKDEREHAEDYDRMLRYKKRLDAQGGMEWLFSEKGIGATQPTLAA
jgi:diadenosine tetraphosphate (Ap4A) HIT family hydrolase